MTHPTKNQPERPAKPTHDKGVDKDPSATDSPTSRDLTRATKASESPNSDATRGRTGEQPSSHDRDDHARPTGTPNSDRYEAETAINRICEDKERNDSMNRPDGLLQKRIRERAYLLWQAADCPSGESDRFWLLAEQETKNEERDYDKTMKDSFPASDPPANSGFTS